MKLWLSGQVDSDIGDSFRHTLNIVEPSVNDTITSNDYGSGLEAWDVIFVISEEGGREMCRYSKKKKESDIRVVLDYELFKNASSISRQRIFLNGLLRSIQLLTEKKIEDLKFEKLELDIKSQLSKIEI
jgi:hypothetical protein